MMTTKIRFISYFTILFLPLLAQKTPQSHIRTQKYMPCDTIVLKSGDVLLAKIRKEEKNYILYCECKDNPSASYWREDKILVHENNVDTIKRAKLSTIQFEYVDTQKKFYSDITAFYFLFLINGSASASYQFNPYAGVGVSWFNNLDGINSYNYNFVTADYRLDLGHHIWTFHAGRVTNLTHLNGGDYCDRTLLKNKLRPALGLSYKRFFNKNTLIGFRCFYTQMPFLDRCYSVPLKTFTTTNEVEKHKLVSLFVGLYFPKHFKRMYYLTPH